MINYYRTSQNQLSFPELLSLTSISIVIACAVELVLGRIDQDSLIRSNSIVIIPQRNYSETSIQGINESSLAYRRDDNAAHNQAVEQEPQRPVFELASTNDSDNGATLGLNQGYSILSREMKNNFKNSTSLFNLLSRVSNRAEYRTSQYQLTTTARPTYDQIPRPMLYASIEDEGDREDGNDTITSTA